MRAKLISRERGEFAIEQVATVGRATGSTVPLEASVVSSEHARISFDEERAAYVLEDLGSLNGTYLDGARIDRQERLGKLHMIRFGDEEEFIFQLVNADPGAAAEPEDESRSDTVGLPASGKTQVGGDVPVLPAVLREESEESEDTGRTRVEKDVVPVPEVLEQAGETVRAREVAGSGFVIEFSLEGSTRRFPLKAGENVVGRGKDAEVRLDVSDLSRRHATLTVTDDSVMVRDEGSRNHTFVDGKQVDKELAVPSGAQIVFGRLEARLIATATGPEPETAESDGKEGSS